MTSPHDSAAHETPHTHDHPDHDGQERDRRHDHERDHGQKAHHHGHGHHGHHHSHGSGRVFALSIFFNALYALIEILAGLKGHSLALIADALHGLGDMMALAAAWWASWLTMRPPTGRHTYGFGSSSILTALGNTVFLLVITGGIAWQSLLRFWAPEPQSGLIVTLVAMVGVFVNGGTAMLFFGSRKQDLNKRAAFQHLMADAGITVGVVIGGVVTMLTHWRWIDPLMGLGISLTIIASSWSLLRDTTRLAMGAVPTHVDSDAVLAWLRGLPGVKGAHDLHIWALSTTQTALTVHLVRPGGRGVDNAFIEHACQQLRERFGVDHVTIQIETDDSEHPCHTDCGAHSSAATP